MPDHSPLPASQRFVDRFGRGTGSSLPLRYLALSTMLQISVGTLLWYGGSMASSPVPDRAVSVDAQSLPSEEVMDPIDPMLLEEETETEERPVELTALPRPKEVKEPKRAPDPTREPIADVPREPRRVPASSWLRRLTPREPVVITPREPRPREPEPKKRESSTASPELAARSPEPIPGKNPKPEYPKRALRLGQQGEVLLRAHIDANGLVESVEVLRSSGHRLLDREAKRSLSGWRFRFGPGVYERAVRFEIEKNSKR